MKQYLTPQQMKELDALGINTSAASMYIGVIKMDSIPTEVVVSGDVATYWAENCDSKFVPTMSFQDIIEEISLIDNSSINIEYPSRISLNLYNSKHNGEVISFGGFGFCDYELIDAAFELLKWCKENKYI